MSISNTIAQTFLAERGFYHGKIDGLWGPLSQAAADAWCAASKPAPAPAQVAAGSVVGDASLITSDHWYRLATLQPIPGGYKLSNPLFLIIHATSGATGQSSIDGWRAENDGVLAHFMIERNGDVTQCRRCDLTCGHAGESQWRDPVTGTTYHGLNSWSIGIELANATADSGALAWARRQPGFKSIEARHSNGGPVQEWECYPTAQINALQLLSGALIARYNIHAVAGHDQISPDRRDDPGPAFPWKEFRRAIGLPIWNG